MEFTHDPIRHMKYLRQSLAQDSESIGFFISAGCPLSVEMPAGKWPLIPDVENLTKHINSELGKDKKYAEMLVELHKSGKNTLNIEDVLSFIRSMLLVSKGGLVRGFNEKELDLLERKICSEIVKKIDVDLPDNETAYHRLSNWIRSIDRKNAIEIFTTNYDLLAEQGLESAEVPYFDGFVGSRRSFFDLRALEDNLIPRHWTRLWKIHGSINWHQELVGEERRVFRSSEVRPDASHLIFPSHLKYEESRKMPYLALIDQLNRFIRKKSSLLVLCGYSFGDGHLNDAICTALKANPTAMVLALQYGPYRHQEVDCKKCDGEAASAGNENNPVESENKTANIKTLQPEKYPHAYKMALKQHNLNVWTDDFAIIGTNLGAWRIPNENKEDLDLQLRSFVTPKDNGHTIALGDFSKFTQFLKSTIGLPMEAG